MERYYYKGDVIVRWPYGSNRLKRYPDKEFLLHAESVSDAYAKLQDKILEEIISMSSASETTMLSLPILEFPGSMTLAINSFETKEAEFDE